MNAYLPRMNAHRNKGLTLVELMISMVLGLVVVGGVVSVLVANKQTYRTNEGVSQVQESARTAFELIARDVRQAAGTGCDNNNRIANVLDPTGTPPWWSVWFGIRGYDNAQTDPAVGFGTWAAAPADNRINGTDSLQLQGLEGTGLSVEDHNQISANIKINATTTQIVGGDVLVVCDFDHAAIFRVSSYNDSNVTLVHNVGAIATGGPENCFKGLGYPTPAPPCSAIGNTYKFGRNSQIAKFAVSDWYIGDNNRPVEGGRSLFRKRLAPGGVLVQEEIAAGVTNMQIAYRLNNTNEFVAASSVTAPNWANVNALQITLTVQSTDQRVSTDATVNNGRLQRDFTSIITFRNRVP